MPAATQGGSSEPTADRDGNERERALCGPRLDRGRHVGAGTVLYTVDGRESYVSVNGAF